MKYAETVKTRPMKRVDITRISFPTNTPFLTIDQLIHILDKTKKGIDKEFEDVYISNYYSEDEHGSFTVEGLVIQGTRHYTDKEWLEELRWMIKQMENDRQRHLKMTEYYNHQWHNILDDAVEKIKLLESRL